MFSVVAGSNPRSTKLLNCLPVLAPSFEGGLSPALNVKGKKYLKGAISTHIFPTVMVHSFNVFL